MAEIFVVNGVCGGTVFFLPDVPTVLGRSQECHVQVSDPWISSMHALFERRGDDLWVVDLDSRNGTFVDEERVQEARIAPGNKIRFGRTSVEIRDQATISDPPDVMSDRSTVVRYISDLGGTPSSSGDDLREEPAPLSVEMPLQTGRSSPTGPRLVQRDMAVLNNIGRALLEANGLEDSLRRLLLVLSSALRAQRSSVFLMDSRGELVPFVAEPFGTPPRLSSTIIDATLRGRAEILTLDAQHDERLSRDDSATAQGTRSCICAPIWADNRLLGVLLLERAIAEPFTSDDRELASVVGFEAALAVERVRISERALATERTRQGLLRNLDPTTTARLLAPDPTGEREILSPLHRDEVAAICASLAGVEELASAVSPAEAAARVFAIQAEFSRLVFAQGGAVESRLDGSSLAIFGLAGLTSDNGVRARRCAEAVLDMVASLEGSRESPRLRVRVGLAVGHALVGNFGTPERPEVRAVGEAVELACRRAIDAPPGGIVGGPRS